MPKGQKLCPGNNKKCGHANGPNAKACAKCKHPFAVSTSTQRCPSCAASLNINSRTCTYCAFFPLKGEKTTAAQVGIRKKSISKKVAAKAKVAKVSKLGKIVKGKPVVKGKPAAKPKAASTKPAAKPAAKTAKPASKKK